MNANLMLNSPILPTHAMLHAVMPSNHKHGCIRSAVPGGGVSKMTRSRLTSALGHTNPLSAFGAGASSSFGNVMQATKACLGLCPQFRLLIRSSPAPCPASSSELLKLFLNASNAFVWGMSALPQGFYGGTAVKYSIFLQGSDGFPKPHQLNYERWQHSTKSCFNIISSSDK